MICLKFKHTGLFFTTVRHDAFARTGIAEVPGAGSRLWRWKFTPGWTIWTQLRRQQSACRFRSGCCRCRLGATSSASVETAGRESTLFTQVTPNPRFDEVTAGATVYAEQGCDVIIAVGGGSAIDCAKCIGLLSANPGGLRVLVGVDNVGAPMPPTTCIPTTAGTSADVSQFAVIADREIKRKLLIISKAVVPDISLTDPATLTTMDAFLTACTGMDALIHALEAYVSLGHLPLTDNHALQAMRSGVHRTEVHELAEAALDDPCVVTNPRQVNQRDIEVIYEELL